MSIKAGRVGVAPGQVDEFGNINSSATSGYTKQEADAKFETQTHAASTYETKSDAAALQPKTLAVPIELLSGSVLTVEDALQGINGEVNDFYDKTYIHNILNFINCSYVAGGFVKIGNVCVVNIRVTSDSAGNVFSIQGFPHYDLKTENSKNIVCPVMYLMSDSVNSALYTQISADGSFSVGAGSSIVAGKEYAINAIYVCNE